jgi:hypothetical protein
MTHRFRDNISNKALRKYINAKHNTPNKKYKPEQYSGLYTEYLGDLAVFRNNQRLKKNENRRNQRKEKEIFKSFLNLGDIAVVPQYAFDKYKKKPKLQINKLEKYTNWWYKKNKIENTHFEITLRSKLNPDIKNTFKFKHINHFNHWIKKVVEETYILNSESWGNVATPTTPEFYNMFENVIVDKIKFITGGCNKHDAGDKKFKSPFYDFKLHNPQSMNNNCFFKCIEYILNEKINITELRKQYNIPTKIEVGINDAYKLLEHFKLNNVFIIDEFYNEELDDENKYILILKNHYYCVQSWEEIIRKKISTKRGLMTFDFETRKTEEYHLIQASDTHSFILKDALCCVYFRPYKSTNMLEKTIITNDEKTSARQFLDFLNQEARHNRSYNVLAHNGGRFDFYFLISVMTDQEIKDAEIQMRGTTVISLNFRGNLFKDSCCFLTDTLENLSNSFKINHGKIVEFDLHNEKISSSQLCFYKPYINFNQFLQLQYEDKDYWKLYEKYCMYDCIALFEIWEKFTICVNSLIEKVSPFLLKKCPLMSSSTIGSHSKKILVEINKFNDKMTWDRTNLRLFIGTRFEKEEAKKGEKENFVEKHDLEKYNFLCNFK